MKIRNCLLMFGAFTLAPIAGCGGDAEGALPIDTHEIIAIHDADASTSSDYEPRSGEKPCVTLSEFGGEPCVPNGDEQCDPYREYPAGHACAPNGEEEECDPYKEYAVGHECWPPVDECEPDGEYPPKHRCEPPKPVGRCWITGGGQLVRDAFGGNAKPFRDGSVDGQWNHVTAGGDHFHGQPDTIACSDAGPPGADHPVVEFNQADFSGSGTWNGASGYTFEVTVIDHGEPGRDDFYSLTVFDSGGGVVYTIDGTISRGNIQVHPPNPGHP